MSTTVIKGPAQIEWNGLKFITQGETTVSHIPESFPVMTDAHGELEERLKARLSTVSFTPSGQWTGEAITILAAAASRLPGTSILSGSLVIKPFISPQLDMTFARAGCTTLPPVILSASKTLFGAITFTCLAAVDSALGNVATGGSFAAPTSTFDPTHILTEPWTASYSPPDLNPDAEHVMFNIETEDGWTLSSELTTDMCRADSVGITDILQTSFKVSASCKPVGVSEADFLELIQRASSSEVALRPGMSFAYNPDAGLFLTSRSGYKVSMANAGVRQGSMAYGSTANRTSGLTFNGIRKFSSGAMQPMLTFAVPA